MILEIERSFSNNFFTMLIEAIAVLVIMGFYYWPLAILLAALFPIYMWMLRMKQARKAEPKS